MESKIKFFVTNCVLERYKKNLLKEFYATKEKVIAKYKIELKKFRLSKFNDQRRFVLDHGLRRRFEDITIMSNVNELNLDDTNSLIKVWNSADIMYYITKSKEKDFICVYVQSMLIHRKQKNLNKMFLNQKRELQNQFFDEMEQLFDSFENKFIEKKNIFVNNNSCF